MQNDYLNRDSRFFCACSYASHLRWVRSNSSASSFRFRHIVKSLSSLAPPLRFSLGLVLLISPFFRTFALSRTKRGNSLRPLLSRIGGIYTCLFCFLTSLANLNRASAISTALSGVKVTTASGVSSSAPYSIHL